MTRFLEKSSSI